MEFLQNNWFWIVLLGLFAWMYASGGGCRAPVGTGVVNAKIKAISIDWPAMIHGIRTGRG